MGKEAVRVTAVREYLKDETGLRISGAGAAKLTGLVGEMFAEVAKRVKAETVSQERNTVLERDVVAAWESFLTSGAPSLLSADALLVAINGLSDEALTALIQALGEEPGR